MAKSWKFKDTRWERKQDLPGGGQGHAYIVEDKRGEFGRCVLKRLKKPDDLGTRRRFKSEIIACCRLNHPNVIRIADAEGIEHDPPYLVVEYCGGGTLETLDFSAKTVVERLQMFVAICEGVAHAHSRGIVHRDLKPANVFVGSDGTPVVGDFGMCFLRDQDHRITSVDRVGGASGGFTAPELRDGRLDDVTPAADVYSLGKMLYWMLAKRSFDRESYTDERFDLRTEGVHQEADVDLVYELFKQCITLHPSERFRDANGLREETNRKIERIRARRRVFEISGQNRLSNACGVAIGSFHDDSIILWNSIEEHGDFRPAGFGVQNRTFAIWGTTGNTTPGITIRFGQELRNLERSHITVGRELFRPAPPSHCMGFDSGDLPRIAYFIAQDSAETSSRGFDVHLVASEGGRHSFSSRQLIEGVGRPTTASMAFADETQIALYCARLGEIGAETCIPVREGWEHQRVRENETLPSSLRFDFRGGLHQALISTTAGGSPGLRELQYFHRSPTGAWTMEIVAQGPAVRWSAQGTLAIKPSGNPAIFCSDPETTRVLAIYTREAEAWTKNGIHVDEIESKIGMTLSGQFTQQAEFDVAGNIHLALTSNGIYASDVVYVCASDRGDVKSARYIPATAFYGFGLDDRGVAHIAVAQSPR